ncbi:MAG: four helix bundle protein [Ignavibacteriae bacterium]|nr:MAG: four helix bundle protein [Ignavibacteriota bacterium]
MTTSKFEELEIYQLAEKLSDIVWNIVMKWDCFPRRTIGVQYVDASDSVGANIAEGYGKGSFADRSRFAKISRGSLFETRHWTNKSYRRKLITDQEFTEINNILEILLSKLSSYINYLNEQSKKQKSN